MIPPGWPSDEILKQLTLKSSGQFIYASVVAKYVKSSRHRPNHRLDVVLNLRPASRDLPFTELDALYTHIFSSVDDIEHALNIISFRIIFQKLPWIHAIEDIFQLDAGEVAILLCDLASVIVCEGLGRQRQLKILHASLVDYLLDSARSKEYFIDTTTRCADHIAACFQFLSDGKCQDPLISRRAMWYFQEYHLSLDLTEPLYNAIRGFSISRIYNSVLTIEPVHSQTISLQIVTLNFLPSLFKFLKKSNSAQYLELYQHHQSQYDFILRENIKACSPESPASLVFALVTIYRELPIGAFHKGFGLFDSTHFADRTSTALQLDVLTRAHLGYLEYLSDFLRNPERSRNAVPDRSYMHRQRSTAYFIFAIMRHLHRRPLLECRRSNVRGENIRRGSGTAESLGRTLGDRALRLGYGSDVQYPMASSRKLVSSIRRPTTSFIFIGPTLT
jgi:hypothetical protein